jgi:hypothetical protein
MSVGCVSRSPPGPIVNHDGSRKPSSARGFALRVVLFYGLLGCGGSLAPVSGSGDSSSPVDSADSADAAALDAAPFEVGPDPADKSCPSAFNCVACCQDHHPTGSDQYGAVIATCICDAGPCGQVCAYEWCVGR